MPILARIVIQRAAVALVSMWATALILALFRDREVLTAELILLLNFFLTIWVSMIWVAMSVKFVPITIMLNSILTAVPLIRAIPIVRMHMIQVMQDMPEWYAAECGSQSRTTAALMSVIWWARLLPTTLPVSGWPCLWSDGFLRAVNGSRVAYWCGRDRATLDFVISWKSDICILGRGISTKKRPRFHALYKSPLIINDLQRGSWRRPDEGTGSWICLWHWLGLARFRWWSINLWHLSYAQCRAGIGAEVKVIGEV